MRKGTIIFFGVILIMVVIVTISIGKFIYENGKAETAVKIANKTVENSIENVTN